MDGLTDQSEQHVSPQSGDVASSLSFISRSAATLCGAAGFASGFCWIGRVVETPEGRYRAFAADIAHAPAPLAEPDRLNRVLALFSGAIQAGRAGRSDALSPRQPLPSDLIDDASLLLCWPLGTAPVAAVAIARVPAGVAVAETTRRLEPLLAGIAILLRPNAPANEAPRTDRRDMIEAIDRLERMRRRELEMRVETEALLSGLRILTQPQAAQFAFSTLLDALRTAMPYEQAAVLRVRWPDGLMLLTGTAPALEGIGWEALRRTDAALPMEPARHDATSAVAKALKQKGLPARSLVSAPLTIRGEQGWLLFATNAEAGFSIGHVGLAARLALLATHALSVEAEKERTVQSSKMAMLGEMATGIAHELAQPVNAIGLTAQNLLTMVRDETNDRASLVTKVERIQNQVNRAAKVIRQMRVFGRRASGQSERFDIAECINNAIDIAGPQLRRIGIDIDVVQETTRRLHGDPTQFEQILVNLLINARDAIEDTQAAGGKAAGQVRILVADDDDDFVRITVRDDGPGFPESVIPLAFEPFFTTKERGRGTGLGLSICRDIAIGMGGTIAAMNDSGACIVLRLPTAEVSALAPTKLLQPIQKLERNTG